MDSVVSVGTVGQGLVAEPADRLRSFRGELYRCLDRQADELFELTDALLCAEGPVHTLSGRAWPRSIAAATALWMTHSTAARSMPSGCGDS